MGTMISGHTIDGNKKDDECAIVGSYLDETMTYNEIHTPKIVVANKIDNCALREITSRCSTIDTCKISRMHWP